MRSTSKHSFDGVSFGFSHSLSNTGIINALSFQANIKCLALPFCECLDEDTLFEIGKMLKHLIVLDIRGCSNIYSITPIMDSLFSQSSYHEKLFILARYTS